VSMQLSFWGYDAVAARALGPTCTLLTQQALDAAGVAYDDPKMRKSVTRQHRSLIEAVDDGDRDAAARAVRAAGIEVAHGLASRAVDSKVGGAE